MKLPQEFIEQMKRELGEEYPAFLAAYESPPWRGLRWNAGKGGARSLPGKDEVRPFPENGEIQFLPAKNKTRPFPEKNRRAAAFGAAVDWCAKGRCFSEDEANALELGRHPFHFAGAYYIQEPSAMLPAELLQAQPGERVLDLCAAPGGKSTQLLDAMEGRGLLVANDISASRGRAVVKNLERFGAGAALVTAETPKRLADTFPGTFDRILVDAPCSGEGMFRRETAMCREWQEKGPDFYQPLQRDILLEAVKMLSPGGRLVYSTCTFNRREDEENAAWLEKTCPELSLLTQEKLWPHRCKGEGQYAAAFERRGTTAGTAAEKDSPGGRLARNESAPAACQNGEQSPKGRAETGRGPGRPSGWGNFRRKGNEAVLDFFSMTTGISWRFENWYERDGRLYELPADIEGLRHLRFLRTGLYLGEIKKGRFEPSQALALYLTGKQFVNTVNFAPQDKRVFRYLKGETLDVDTARGRGGDGWRLVCYDGLPLGWAKQTGGILKNKYAPGWRLQS